VTPEQSSAYAGEVAPSSIPIVRTVARAAVLRSCFT
jgi:hypothetical protein